MNNGGRKVGEGHIANSFGCLTKESEFYAETTNIM